MAAIKDVAKLANVSVGTVSRYLNDPDSLRPAYRERVQKAVTALNYQPSRLAQAMRTKRTNMIALVVPEMQNQFYIELYTAIRLSCYQHGYTPVMYTMESGTQMLEHLFTGNGAAQIDGMILAFMDDPGSLALIDKISGSTPFVLMTCKSDISASYSSILSDVYSGAYEAANHILSLGHKKIAFVGHVDNPLNMNEKLSGVKRALKEQGIPFDPDYYAEGASIYSTGYNAARKVMRMEPPPSAIVAGNDMIAAGVLKYLSEYQYRIPEDVAVIGFDGIELGAICTPALSTVIQPIEAMGQAAVKTLLEKINNPDIANTQSVFRPRLLIRQSTRRDAPLTLHL